MSVWRDRATVGVAVVAALAVGQAITAFDVEESAAGASFIRSGEVGERIDMEYADVTVTSVLVGNALATVDGGVKAAGRFLIVDAEIEAGDKPVILAGVYVLDAEDRAYLPDSRTACAPSVDPLVGTTVYARFCIDVPESALPGARLVLSRGSFDYADAFQRRDEVAEIDLGIGADDATELWNEAKVYREKNVEYEPIDTAPFEEVES